MNPVLEAIKTRKSIRVYKPDPVRREDLEAILDAGGRAPAGLTMGSRRFTALTGPRTLGMVNEAIRSALLSIAVTPETHPYVQSLISIAQREDANFTYHAPCYIIVSAQKDNPSALADCAVAIENMLLAAHSLGLGACWLNQLPGLHALAEVQGLMAQLDIPPEHAIFGAFSLGYSAEGEAASGTARNRSSIRIYE